MGFRSTFFSSFKYLEIITLQKETPLRMLPITAHPLAAHFTTAAAGCLSAQSSGCPGRGGTAACCCYQTTLMRNMKNFCGLTGYRTLPSKYKTSPYSAAQPQISEQTQPKEVSISSVESRNLHCKV